MIDLAKLKALYEAASPGPWVTNFPDGSGSGRDVFEDGDFVSGDVIVCDHCLEDGTRRVHRLSVENAAFIAAARSAVPELDREGGAPGNGTARHRGIRGRQRDSTRRP